MSIYDLIKMELHPNICIAIPSSVESIGNFLPTGWWNFGLHEERWIYWPPDGLTAAEKDAALWHYY
jgi:hypothetical protein